ncbi:putative inner membrane protein [Roseibium album]|nr:putative inner membrane protein [Roseibium album]
MESADIKPNGQNTDKTRFQTFLIGLTALAIGAAFLGLVWDYLIALFLASVFSAMASPLYRWIYRHLGERKNLSVGVTLFALAIGLLLPLSLIIVLGAQQAASVALEVTAWVENLDLPAIEKSLPSWIPFKVDFAQWGATIATKVGQAAGQIADFFVTALSQATRGTVRFFLNLFIMVYAMIFFLPQKTNMFIQLLAHTGLPEDTQKSLGTRVISISRATIKGTFLIGVTQGLLGGLGFWATGLSGAAFWGCVMAVLSVIPGIGPTLVLIPGVIVLAANDQYVAAVGLAVWTGLAVTTVDNLLRPILVGRDTQMPDLLVLVSTFGGLAAFGAVGLVLGPVIAGLFITIWSVLEDHLQADGLSDKPTETPPDTNESSEVSNRIHELQQELADLKGQREAPETN